MSSCKLSNRAFSQDPQARLSYRPVHIKLRWKTPGVHKNGSIFTAISRCYLQPLMPINLVECLWSFLNPACTWPCILGHLADGTFEKKFSP